MRDDFGSFLDRAQYFPAGTKHDAIGLPPGSAPRDRHLVGHRMYSEMTRGVGRGTIFNHRDPLGSDEDFEYTVRTVERFKRVIVTNERKLFVIMNVNKQLWVESDLRELFVELSLRTRNFELVAIDCARNLGLGVCDAPVESLGVDARESGSFAMYRFPCVGDNTGSYFREECDAERMRTFLVDSRTFRLVADPFPQHEVLRAPLSAPDGCRLRALNTKAAPRASGAAEDGDMGACLEVQRVPAAPAASPEGEANLSDKVLSPAEAKPLHAVVHVRRWGSRRQQQQ